MAKVLYTAFLADMRNKVNGTVFSKNRYGAYARTKVTPVNPQTTSQQAARNRLSTNAQAWRGLTEEQRQGWIDAAPNFPFSDIFGNSKILSGQTLYVKLNNNLMLIDQGPIADAPLPVAIDAVPEITATITDVPAFSITFTPTPTSGTASLVFFATGNVTPGKSFVKNLYRFIGFIGDGTASPQNLLARFQAVHGNPVAGQKIFLKAFYIDQTTGQAGIPTQTVTIVA